MSENFDKLKQELLEYDKNVRGEDEFEKSFNALTNNQTLRTICDKMQKEFPKQPTLQDINAMIYVYTNLNPNSIKENDQKDWVKQLANFAKKCPENYEDQRRLEYTMASLKMAKASPETTYAIGKKIVEKLTPNSSHKDACLNAQLENADNYHKYLLEYAQNDKNFASYQDQTKAFTKAANILTEVKSTVRWNRFNDFKAKMRTHYMKSEWGQVNFTNECNKISKKIFKSLPLASRNAMHTNRARSEFYAR